MLAYQCKAQLPRVQTDVARGDTPLQPVLRAATVVKILTKIL